MQWNLLLARRFQIILMRYFVNNFFKKINCARGNIWLTAFMQLQEEKKKKQFRKGFMLLAKTHLSKFARVYRDHSMFQNTNDSNE